MSQPEHEPTDHVEVQPEQPVVNHPEVQIGPFGAGIKIAIDELAAQFLPGIVVFFAFLGRLVGKTHGLTFG